MRPWQRKYTVRRIGSDALAPLYTTTRRSRAMVFGHVYCKGGECEVQIRRINRQGQVTRTWTLGGFFSDWPGDDW